MSLELRKVHIRDVVLGGENRLTDGVLFIDTKELESLILEDHRIRSVSFDLARPGESVRILPVKDVIEPRAKLEGGSSFPGVLDESMTAGGRGITVALKGCVVTTTGPIVGFQEGLIDMSGPGADYTIFSQYINIVVIIDKHDDVNPHEHEEVVRIAGVKAAAHIGEIGVTCEEYEKTVYDWPVIGERYAQYPDLPKVAYVCNCMSQGLLHDTYFYGRDTKKMVPTMVSPLEFMDGALVSGNCVSPGSKTTTFHHLNNAVIDELFERHGKELNFVGLVLNPMMVTLKEKYRGAMLVADLVESLGVEAALITQEGFGNPTTDLMMACKNLEDMGIKTVIVTNEDAGTDGLSESLPDMVVEADAIVTTGNSNATLLLPKVDRVIGKLEDIERVTGGNVDSIKPDGTLLVEIHGIMGSHNLQGNTLLTAITV